MDSSDIPVDGFDVWDTIAKVRNQIRVRVRVRNRLGLGLGIG